MATSRKDDLISLTYMMFFLLNENKLPLQDDKFFEKLEKFDGDPQKTFQFLLKFKKKCSLFDLSQHIEFPWLNKDIKSLSKEANIKLTSEELFSSLGQFSKEIMNLGFDEKPNYSKLKNILTDTRAITARIKNMINEEEEKSTKIFKKEKKNHGKHFENLSQVSFYSNVGISSVIIAKKD